MKQERVSFGVMHPRNGLLHVEALTRQKQEELAINELVKRNIKNFVIDEISAKGAELTVTFHIQDNLQLMEESLEDRKGTAVEGARSSHQRTHRHRRGGEG